MWTSANLPGRSRAGSNRSGLFVAPITNTSVVLCIPSSSDSNCDTTLKTGKSDTVEKSAGLQGLDWWGSRTITMRGWNYKGTQFLHLTSNLLCKGVLTFNKIHVMSWIHKINVCIRISSVNFISYLSITPPESPDLPLFGASESNSSKKITQGEAARALEKTCLTFSSDWPTYMLINSGPFTLHERWTDWKRLICIVSPELTAETILISWEVYFSPNFCC